MRFAIKTIVIYYIRNLIAIKFASNGRKRLKYHFLIKASVILYRYNGRQYIN